MKVDRWKNTGWLSIVLEDVSTPDFRITVNGMSAETWANQLLLHE